MSRSRLEDLFDKEWLDSIKYKVEHAREGGTPVIGDSFEEVRDLNPIMFGNPDSTTAELSERLRRALVKKGYEGEELENEMKLRLGLQQK